MLTKEMIQAFKIHQRMNFYLPSLIVVWDFKFQTLSLNRSYISWIVWGTGMLNGVTVAIGHAYILSTHFFYNTRKNLGLTTLFIIMGGLVGILIALVTALVILRHIKYLIAAYNEMHNLVHRMATSKNL